MMKNIVDFYHQAKKAIENSTADNKITWARLKAHMGDTIYKIISQKFEVPTPGTEDILIGKYKELNEEIMTAFRSLED